MKTESNKGVYTLAKSHTHGMTWNDFSLLSHPSPSPLVSQSNKHHKEPMFLHLLHSSYIFFTSLCYYCSKLVTHNNIYQHSWNANSLLVFSNYSFSMEQCCTIRISEVTSLLALCLMLSGTFYAKNYINVSC